MAIFLGNNLLFSSLFWVTLPLSLSLHLPASLYSSLFLIAVVGFMGLNVDDSRDCGGGPRVGRDEEMGERRTRSREGRWVARGAEICKQI